MKILKLKDIIRSLYDLSDCILYQGDVYTNDHEQKWEEVYTGAVMGIPWYLLDYYITSTPDGGGIGCFIHIDNKRAYFDIYLCENKEMAKKYLKGEI